MFRRHGLSKLSYVQVFVGSFRGGKRGGSRTAHLKGAAATAPQPCASCSINRASPSSTPHAAPSDTNSSNPHAAAHDSSADWADDIDAVISESSEPEDEDCDKQDTDQQLQVTHLQNDPANDELKFEVDVVDTLGALSQTPALAPTSMSGVVNPLPGGQVSTLLQVHVTDVQHLGLQFSTYFIDTHFDIVCMHMLLTPYHKHRCPCHPSPSPMPPPTYPSVSTPQKTYTPIWPRAWSTAHKLCTTSDNAQTSRRP